MCNQILVHFRVASLFVFGGVHSFYGRVLCQVRSHCPLTALWTALHRDKFLAEGVRRRSDLVCLELSNAPIPNHDVGFMIPNFWIRACVSDGGSGLFICKIESSAHLRIIEA